MMLDDIAAKKFSCGEFPTVNDWNNRYFKPASWKVTKVDTQVHHIVMEAFVKHLKASGLFPNLADVSLGSVPGGAYSVAKHAELCIVLQEVSSETFKSMSFAKQATRYVEILDKGGFKAEAALAGDWLTKMGIIK
jgi:hypothetical protein